MTERLARAAAAHPWRTVALWLVALVLAAASAGGLLFPNLVSEQRLTYEPESYRAERLLEEAFARPDEADEIVVVRSEKYTIDDAAFARFARRLEKRLRSTRAIASARTFWATNQSTLISTDRHATIAPIFLGADPETGIERVIAEVETADRDPEFEVAIVGGWTIDRDFNTLALKDLKEGELFFGAPAALVILLFVFGALLAAGVPLVLSAFAIMLALGASGLLTRVTELSIFLQNMVTAVGLALGIDYSLFVLSRYREERAAGREKLDAIAAAGATASRAVLFSGTAFVIALVGLLLVPDNIMRSLAIGAILVGIFAVLAALTLLPALLSLLGDRTNAGRIPFVSRRVTSGERQARFWTRVVRAVMARPVVSLVAATTLLLAAAVPVLDLKMGFPTVSSFPDGTVSKKGLEALDRDFQGGQTDPVQVVVAGDIGSPEVSFALEEVASRAQDFEVLGPSSVRSSAQHDVAVLDIPYSGGATEPAAIAAVRALRSEIIPQAFAGTDAEALVTGETAQDIDYFDTMDYWLPIVFAFVLGLSFLLLTIAFRSIVVAVKAIALNLLSVGAAYGLLVLVFQKGVGNELLGFTQVDSIVAWVPLFLFCVLFGLSMDYHVFLLSRIRERFTSTGDNAEAVAFGIGTTARLITGAALIIIVVFVGFASGDLVMFQQMGFGVAVALLLDATIVRTVLVPAAMVLLGRANWYLPRWLEWLPDVRVEGKPVRG